MLDILTSLISAAPDKKAPSRRSVGGGSSSGEESGIFFDEDEEAANEAEKRDPRVAKKVERLSLVYDMLKTRVDFGGSPAKAWDNDFRSLCAEWEIVRTRGSPLQQRDTDILFVESVSLWMAYRLAAPCFPQKVPAVFEHCDVGERILVSYLGLDGLGWGDLEPRAKAALRSLRATRRKAVTGDTKMLTSLAVRQQEQMREMQALKQSIEAKQKKLFRMERKMKKK